MASLEKCKALLSKKSKTDAYFLKLHFCVEALIKRLLFIGLRLNNVQYKDAQGFLTRYDPQGLRNMLKRAWELIGISENELAAYPKYQKLRELVFEFTAKYRNDRVHGKRDEITSKDILELLITIDKLFIDQMRTILKDKKNADIFDKPKQFNAGKVNDKRDSQDILKKVIGGRGRLFDNPKYTPEEVKEILENLNK
jgi:hypothetical protein